jgi:hypothetical protein
MKETTTYYDSDRRKDTNNIIFSAERQVLLALPRIIGDKIHPIYQDIFSGASPEFVTMQYIADISSHDGAESLLESYGLLERDKSGFYTIAEEEFTPPSAPYKPIKEYIAPKYGLKSPGLLAKNRSILQAIWLEHHYQIERELPEVAEIFRQEYVLTEQEAQQHPKDHTRKGYARAKANLNYYRDRLYILEKEDQILKFMQALYPQQYTDMFSTHYRIGKKLYTRNNERMGAKLEVLREEEHTLAQSLEAGRILAEHLHGDDLGSRLWTDSKGKMARDFESIGKAFPNRVQEYNRQRKIAKLLETSHADILNEWERRLLELTAASVLNAGTKIDGVRAFFEEQDIKNEDPTFWAASIANIERKLLGEEYTGNRLNKKKQKIDINDVLRSRNETYSAVRSLVQGMLLLKMNPDMERKEIVEKKQLNCKPNDFGGARLLVENLIRYELMKTDSNINADTEVTIDMINEYFAKTNKIPEELNWIINQMRKMSVSNVEAVATKRYQDKIRINLGQVYGLKMLILGYAQKPQQSVKERETANKIITVYKTKE